MLAPTEGLGGAALVGRVLHMVSEPTLVIARTGQCADIGRMALVGLVWDTRHGI
jgi:fumarylacetoacetate (FAA) hydrolase family protein